MFVRLLAGPVGLTAWSRLKVDYPYWPALW